MIEYKLYHTNAGEYHRFSHPLISSKEEFSILLKKIVTLCKIQNKSKLEYYDEVGDKIQLKNYNDVETMFRLRLLGKTVLLVITEVDSI